jgi:hypothetical protein
MKKRIKTTKWEEDEYVQQEIPSYLKVSEEWEKIHYNMDCKQEQLQLPRGQKIGFNS